MAEAAVTVLLENLVQLVKHQAALIAGAKDELELLKEDLASLKVFLSVAASMATKPEGFLDIESRIRDVVYEAEDTIDSCMTYAATKPKTTLLRHLSSKRLNLAQEVRSLRERKVIGMVATANSFAAAAMVKGSKACEEQSSSKCTKLQKIREENVVGFDENEAKIISYLVEKDMDVISITGMPGLGKTTLAWKVFKSKFVKCEFPNRIWVYVTQTPNIREVFLTILKEFTSEDMSSLSGHALAQTIQKYLKERKFLLVLDDVWTTDDWDDIRVVLSKSDNMSKVLITSRHKNVGAKACQPRQPYELPFLNNDDSWKLLQYEVFGKLDECHHDLESVGECIAHKCDGLPLSIVVIGGILVDLCTKNVETGAVKESWLKVSADVSEFLKNDKKQRVSDIVELSYNRLPDELRDCFLYLAVFPEDYEISVWTLTRLWIAEGFIQGPSLEETAEENLKDMIIRNLVMVGERNCKGEVKTCRVHDVVRAFCRLKASLKQQNLFQEMKVLNGAFDPPISEIDRCRRLCIYSHLENFLTQTKKQKKGARFRSLLCFNKTPAKLNPKYTPTMVDGFDLLRVLESKLIKLGEIPGGVTNLIHLRYITISVDTLKTLPRNFSNLWNLQTLVVYTREESFTIKANLWRLIQLRHLKIKAVITQLVAQGDGECCENLQTLSTVSPGICTKDVFKRAPHLKTLGIQGKIDDLFSITALGMLKQLEKLKLVCASPDSESESLMPFPELRNWFPPSLKMLTISATNLNWKHMSTLSKIETLQVLKLKSNAFTGDSWEATGRGFRDLHLLLIDETNLFNWNASDDSFPSLRHLVLKNCKKLNKIPEGAAKGLEKLDIEHLSESAIMSARKLEEVKKQSKRKQRATWCGGEFKLAVGAGCESYYNRE